jgi:co-chaperonin GroES (HSP10)
MIVPLVSVRDIQKQYVHSCLGTKYHQGKEENGECPDCTVGTSDARKTYGKVLCTVCGGKGGTIIVPDDKKINTTTGDVLAISRDGIRQVKIGDKVLFTNYTGSPFKFLKKDLRVVHEKDLLCIVKQLKRTTQGLTEGGFADIENVGIAHE